MICSRCKRDYNPDLGKCPHCGTPIDYVETSYNTSEIFNTASNVPPYNNYQHTHDNQYNYGSQQNNQYNGSTPQNNQYKYGNQQNNQYNYNNQQNCDTEDASLIKVLGFFLGLLFPALWFLPVISLVLFFVWRQNRPNASNAIGKFTLIGILVGLGLAVFLAIVITILIVCLATGPLLHIAKEIIENIIPLIPFHFLRDILYSIFNLISNLAPIAIL